VLQPPILFLERFQLAGVAHLHPAAHVSAARGVRCEAGQVFITSGTQQAFDEILRLAIDPKRRGLGGEPRLPRRPACGPGRRRPARGAQAEFNDTGLTANTSYSYRVRVTDAAGNLGTYSNMASATTLAFQAPTGLREARRGVSSVGHPRQPSVARIFPHS
jgi:hypothetical protein